MSMLIASGAAGVIVNPQFAVLSNDERVQDPTFIKDAYFGLAPFEQLWPRTHLQCQSAGYDLSFIQFDPYKFEYDVRWQGNKNRKKFSGITKDLNGTVLPGCAVQLFRTLDDLIISETVSNTIGYYEVYSQYDTEHYLVAYKAGAQDVAGTTKNTILGT